MLVNQDGLYATCRRGHILGPLFIDHDHACCNKKWTCGKCVPGLLCGYRNCWLIDVELERNHHKHSGHWWSAAVAYLCDRGCDPADQERLVAHVEIHRQGRVGWRGRRPEGFHYFNHETDAGPCSNDAQSSADSTVRLDQDAGLQPPLSLGSPTVISLPCATRSRSAKHSFVPGRETHPPGDDFAVCR
jgi:hypothetical protein